MSAFGSHDGASADRVPLVAAAAPMSTAPAPQPIDSAVLLPGGRNLLVCPSGRPAWTCSLGAHHVASNWGIGSVIIKGALSAAGSSASATSSSSIGDRVVTWSTASALQLREGATGALLRSFEGHVGTITCAQLLAADRTIASCSSDNTMRLWDADTGACRRVFEGHAAAVNGVIATQRAGAASLISWSDDRTLRIWDVSKTSSPLQCNALTSAGIRCRNPCKDDGLCALHASVLANKLRTVAVAPTSPADSRLSEGSRCTARLGNGERCQEVTAFGGFCRIHSAASPGAAGTSPARQQCRGHTARGDRCMKYAHEDGFCHFHAPEHRDHRFDPDDSSPSPLARSTSSALPQAEAQLLTPSKPGAKPAASSLLQTPLRSAVLSGHTDTIIGATATQDGSMLASCSADGTLRVWTIATGTCRLVLAGHGGAVTGAFFFNELSANRMLVSWSTDATVRAWDTASGSCLRELAGHTAPVIGALQLDARRIISWSADCSIRMWDLSSGVCLRVLQGHTRRINGALLLPDGTLVSWSADGTIRGWDLGTGACMWSQTAPAPAGASATDGRIVAGNVKPPWPPLASQIDSERYQTMVRRSNGLQRRLWAADAPALVVEALLLSRELRSCGRVDDAAPLLSCVAGALQRALSNADGGLAFASRLLADVPAELLDSLLDYEGLHASTGEITAAGPVSQGSAVGSKSLSSAAAGGISVAGVAGRRSLGDSPAAGGAGAGSAPLADSTDGHREPEPDGSGPSSRLSGPLGLSLAGLKAIIELAGGADLLAGKTTDWLKYHVVLPTTHDATCVPTAAACVRCGGGGGRCDRCQPWYRFCDDCAARADDADCDACAPLHPCDNCGSRYDRCCTCSCRGFAMVDWAKRQETAERLPAGSLVAQANVFVSHAYHNSFVAMFQTLAAWEARQRARGEAGPFYFYVDLFSNNQHPQNAVLPFSQLRNTFAAGVRAVGRFIFLLDYPDFSPLSRLWCVFEVTVALLLGVPFSIQLPPDHDAAFCGDILRDAASVFARITSSERALGADGLVDVRGRVDTEHARAREGRDKTYITRLVRCIDGGFARVDQFVLAALDEWLAIRAIASRLQQLGYRRARQRADAPAVFAVAAPPGEVRARAAANDGVRTAWLAASGALPAPAVAEGAAGPAAEDTAASPAQGQPLQPAGAAAGGAGAAQPAGGATAATVLAIGDTVAEPGAASATAAAAVPAVLPAAALSRFPPLVTEVTPKAAQHGKYMSGAQVGAHGHARVDGRGGLPRSPAIAAAAVGDGPVAVLAEAAVEAQPASESGGQIASGGTGAPSHRSAPV